MRARVTDRGFVRTHTLRQTLSDDGFGGAVVIVVSTQYLEIGSTTVERPVWYNEALTATNATTSNRTETSAQFVEPTEY